MSATGIKIHGLMRPLNGIMLDKDNIPSNPQENMFFVINGQPCYYGRRHPGGNLEWISLFEGLEIEALVTQATALSTALTQANQTIASMQSSITALQTTVTSLQTMQTDFNTAMDTIANSINSIAATINP